MPARVAAQPQRLGLVALNDHGARLAAPAARQGNRFRRTRWFLSHCSIIPSADGEEWRAQPSELLSALCGGAPLVAARRAKQRQAAFGDVVEDGHWLPARLARDAREGQGPT